MQDYIAYLPHQGLSGGYPNGQGVTVYGRHQGHAAAGEQGLSGHPPETILSPQGGEGELEIIRGGGRAVSEVLITTRSLTRSQNVSIQDLTLGGGCGTLRGPRGGLVAGQGQKAKGKTRPLPPCPAPPSGLCVPSTTKTPNFSAPGFPRCGFGGPLAINPRGGHCSPRRLVDEFYQLPGPPSPKGRITIGGARLSSLSSRKFSKNLSTCCASGLLLPSANHPSRPGWDLGADSLKVPVPNLAVAHKDQHLPWREILMSVKRRSAVARNAASALSLESH